MGPALRTIVSATLRSVAFIAFVVVLILVLLPAALVEAERQAASVIQVRASRRSSHGP